MSKARKSSIPSGAYRLSERQKAFARGVALGKTAAKACRDAGYSSSYANRQALKLLENPKVKAYFQELSKAIAGREVETIKTRRIWWTQVMRGEFRGSNARIKLMLRASELLGRSQGDFVHRHEVTGPAGGPIDHVARVEYYIPKNDRDQPQGAPDAG